MSALFNLQFPQKLTTIHVYTVGKKQYVCDMFLIFFLRKPRKKVELIGFKQTISVSSEVPLPRWHFKHKLFLRRPLHCPNTHAKLFCVPKPTPTDRVNHRHVGFGWLGLPDYPRCVRHPWLWLKANLLRRMDRKDLKGQKGGILELRILNLLGKLDRLVQHYLVKVPQKTWIGLANAAWKQWTKAWTVGRNLLSKPLAIQGNFKRW